MARAMRWAASSMPLRWLGSGSRSRRRGSRNDATVSAVTPRPASTRATISGSPACWASPRASRSSLSRARQRLPVSERSTPRKGIVTAFTSGARNGAGGLAREVVRGLDQADGPGLGAHDDRMRGGTVLEPAHAAQHRAVGDAGGGKHHVALGHIEQVVFAAQVLDAPLGGALALVFAAKDETALHLAADTAQRCRGQHALGRTSGAEIDVDTAVGPRRGNDPAHV